ncbi:MAG: NADH:ubiquinone reductase (Na(+)-transporting) subunit C [Planctomycetes bacterium]|nr:NADH:ubiquinone reductase (Na(+)-transporting) subunit C [Planctomycetota bacterium]
MSRDVNKPSYTMAFAVVTCVICSLMLSGVYAALNDRIKFNLRIENMRSVLISAGLADDQTTGKMVETTFKSLKGECIDRNGTVVEEPADYDSRPEFYIMEKGLVKVYKAVLDGKLEAFIVPVNGTGLWGPLKGYLALEKDGNTVKGIRFYEHKETPGLGAEIESAHFRENFHGKTLLADGEYKGITVVKGKVENVTQNPSDAKHMVDGISGATLTGDGVTKIFSEFVASRYLPYLRANAVR